MRRCCVILCGALLLLVRCAGLRGLTDCSGVGCVGFAWSSCLVLTGLDGLGPSTSSALLSATDDMVRAGGRGDEAGRRSEHTAALAAGRGDEDRLLRRTHGSPLHWAIVVGGLSTTATGERGSERTSETRASEPRRTGTAESAQRAGPRCLSSSDLVWPRSNEKGAQPEGAAQLTHNDRAILLGCDWLHSPTRSLLFSTQSLHSSAVISGPSLSHFSNIWHRCCSTADLSLLSLDD